MSSPQFSHMILPVGSGSCTRFELSLTELRNVRDTYSVASYVGQSHGKNAYNSCLPKAVSVLGCFLAAYISWITDFSGPWLSDHAVRHKNSACQYALTMWWRHSLRPRGRETHRLVTWWKSSRPLRGAGASAVE